MLRQSGDMSRLTEAAKRFSEAIEIEPTFARAYAGLCRVGVRIYNRTRDPADLHRAEQACRQRARSRCLAGRNGEGAREPLLVQRPDRGFRGDLPSS